MNKNKSILVLSLLYFSSIASAQKLCVGLELSPLVSKVDSQNKPFFWQKLFFRSKPVAPTCLGMSIHRACERASLDIPSNMLNLGRYTITETIDALDLFICKRIVQEGRIKGLDLNNLSTDGFHELNAIKRQYYDALPFILRQGYCSLADPYVAAIGKARSDFEAKNNGALLELR